MKALGKTERIENNHGKRVIFIIIFFFGEKRKTKLSDLILCSICDYLRNL